MGQQARNDLIEPKWEKAETHRDQMGTRLLCVRVCVCEYETFHKLNVLLMQTYTHSTYMSNKDDCFGINTLETELDD